MFIVFNKRKVYSYLVSFSTVVILFVMAFTITTDSSIITSANAENKVNTKETQNSIVMDCEWKNNEIDEILKILKNKNVKMTFRMSDEWKNKFPEVVKKILESGQEIYIDNNV